MKYDYSYEGWKRPEFNNRSPRNMFYVTALFLETIQDRVETTKPVYTLQEQEVTKEGITYPSAYQVILNSINEYEAAERLLGSYRHWNYIKNKSRIVFYDGLPNTSIVPLAIALADMDERLYTQSMRDMEDQAAQGNVTAQKYLAGDKKKIKQTKQKQDDQPIQIINNNSPVIDMAKRFREKQEKK